MSDDLETDLALMVWTKLAPPTEIVTELRRLGARFRVVPPTAHDDVEAWTFRARTNLSACRKILKMAATYAGGGWSSCYDMAPGKAVQFGDRRYNSRFVAAIREARRCH